MRFLPIPLNAVPVRFAIVNYRLYYRKDGENERGKNVRS